MTSVPLGVTPVRWVRQEDVQGCGIAVLAMLTGRTYADVRGQLDAESERDHDWSTSGTSHLEIDRVLVELGYAMQRRYRAWFENRIVENGVTRWELKPGAAWPPEPWAPVHYASVEQPSGRNHFVVMLADGVVLDPLREGESRLTDWPGVNQVTGLHLAQSRRREDGPVVALFCGSRRWADPAPIDCDVMALPRGSVVIEGGQVGADRLARKAARARGLHVATVEPLWDYFGPSAGPRRLLQPDVVYAYPLDRPGTGPGTRGMIDLARKAGIEVIVRGR